MKEFLSQKGVRFVERNVDTDPQARQELEDLMGQVIVPVTAFGPYEVIRGYEPDRLEQKLIGEGFLDEK